MAFRPDDLTPLLVAGGQSDVGFHQGIVETWSSDTGANTVNVNGSILSDVPILNTGEAIALRTGHVVGLLRFRTTYFILGRITVPGNPDFASASVAFDVDVESAANFGINTTFTTKATSTLTVPSWADEALVIATASATALNNRAVTDGLSIACDIISGGVVMTTTVDANELGSVTSSYSRLIASPGATIDVLGKLATVFGTWAAAPQNGIVVSASAVYRSTT